MSKEYIKYEDGDVVPATVEEKQKEKTKDIQSSLKDIKKTIDTSKNSIIKKFNNDKSSFIKNIFIVLLIVSSIFIVYYYFLYNPDQSEQLNQPQLENNIEIEENTTKSEETPLEQETIKESSNKANYDYIKDPLKLTEFISDEIYHLNQSENLKVDNYLKNKQTKISTIKYIKKIAADKNRLYLTLKQDKDLFKSESFKSLYSLTEIRLNESIEKSNNIIYSLESNKKSSVKDFIESHNSQDTEIKKAYDELIVLFLEALDIPFEREEYEVYFNIDDIS